MQLYKYADIQVYKYTNTQINKDTNIQLNNTQINKYTEKILQ